MTKDMTSGSPMRHVLSFAAPLILGNLFQQLYSLVDVIIVGRLLGTKAFAAVGSTGSISFLLIGFCLGICSGFSIPVAQRFGAKDYTDMKRYEGNILWLGMAFSLVMATVPLYPAVDVHPAGYHRQRLSLYRGHFRGDPCYHVL